MVYVYDCCGEQIQSVSRMNTCPLCGRRDAYNFMATTLGSSSRAHRRVHSIPGLRNYYDEGMGTWVGENKKEVMAAKNMVYASNAEAWDG